MSLKVFTNYECLKDGSIMIGLLKEAQKREEKHLHEFIEFVYVMDGQMTHYINGEEFFTQKGSLLIINKGETHEYYTSGLTVFINLHIVPEKLEDADNFYRQINAVLKQMGSKDSFSWNALPHLVQFGGMKIIEIENLLRYMINEINSRPLGYETMLKECLMMLLIEVERRIHETSSELKEYYGSVKFFEIKNYIDENCCKKISLVNIAKDFYCSPVYLGRLFKKCMGKSYIEYVRDRRIEKAIEYLITTNITIEEVAMRVGYSDKTQFYSIFEKYTGKTPKKFRDDSANAKNVFLDMYKK